MADKPLNVVWFCTDQQRYDTIGALGNPYIKTPNLDRLCAEGVAFANAFCQSPVCTPSRASFLTGRYPRSARVCFNGNLEFPAGETLVTKRLADAGYTCGLAGKLHLTSAQSRAERRTDDGYSFFAYSHHPYDDWSPGGNHYQDWLREKGIDWKTAYGGGNAGKKRGIAAAYHQTTWCVERAIEFIDAQPEGRPWLISINPFDPHPPLDPPEAYRDRLRVEDMPLPLWKDGEMAGKPPHVQRDHEIGGQNGAAVPIGRCTDMDKREKTRDYYAEIALIDDQAGRLLAYLEATGQRENTLFIYMSDHGEMNGDHGVYLKGAYFYEGIVHVPLIFSCPGLIEQGLVSDALVELVDVAPTILDLTGREVPPAMQGRSLAGILTGKAGPHHHKDAVYCEWYGSLRDAHSHLFATMYRDTRHKLVVYHGEAYGELYDLEADPCEFDNLYGQPAHADLQARLKKKSFDQAVLGNIDRTLAMGNRY